MIYISWGHECNDARPPPASDANGFIRASPSRRAGTMECLQEDFGYPRLRDHPPTHFEYRPGRLFKSADRSSSL